MIYFIIVVAIGMRAGRFARWTIDRGSSGSMAASSELTDRTSHLAHMRLKLRPGGLECSRCLKAVIGAAATTILSTTIVQDGDVHDDDPTLINTVR